VDRSCPARPLPTASSYGIEAIVRDDNGNRHPLHQRGEELDFPKDPAR